MEVNNSCMQWVNSFQSLLVIQTLYTIMNRDVTQSKTKWTTIDVKWTNY